MAKNISEENEDKKVLEKKTKIPLFNKKPSNKPTEEINQKSVEDIDIYNITEEDKHFLDKANVMEMLEKSYAESINSYDELYFEDKFNMNSISLFDVGTYREMFMSMRKELDELYESRNSSKENYEKYNTVFTNLFSFAVDDCAAQDFLGYCFKKGKYPFTKMNFEKYMDFTLLAASFGNAFSLQRLQMFMTSALDKLYEEGRNYKINEELGLTVENYDLFLIKIICDICVKKLNLTASRIVERPNIVQPQTDVLLRKYQRIRDEAVEEALKEIDSSASHLGTFYDELFKDLEFVMELEELDKKEAEMETAKTSSSNNEISDIDDKNPRLTEEESDIINNITAEEISPMEEEPKEVPKKPTAKKTSTAATTKATNKTASKATKETAEKAISKATTTTIGKVAVNKTATNSKKINSDSKPKTPKKEETEN